MCVFWMKNNGVSCSRLNNCCMSCQETKLSFSKMCNVIVVIRMLYVNQFESSEIHHFLPLYRLLFAVALLAFFFESCCLVSC
jgi:hypothetical protein